MDRLLHNRSLILFALVLVLVPACTSTRVMEVNVNRPTGATSNTSSKAPLKVALVIDAALHHYKYHFKFAGDDIYPFGEALCTYAQDTVRNAFEEVFICGSLDEAKNRADAILIPKAVKSDRVMGMWAWDGNSWILIVEWTMKDPSGHNTLWMTTIEGRAWEPGGTSLTIKSRERALIQSVFDDLYLKTAQAFSESPEIKRLALQAK